MGNGIGYTIILVIVGFFRELLGSGTLFGYQVVPQCFYDAGYANNGLMILPPMALIVVACIIWVHRSRNKDLQEKIIRSSPGACPGQPHGMRKPTNR